MGRAHLRFYGDLADLLAPSHRQTAVPVDFDVAPTAKDAVEALGVPHTEVELLVVDAAPIGFDHRLVDGERIAVYPAFADLELTGMPTLRPAPPDPPAFVVDGHLGTLARRLRLLGFDTDYDPNRADDDLAAISAGDGRVLLTRDRGLLKRRIVRLGLLVRSDDPDEQVVDVLRRLGGGDRLRPFTRCTACNGLLRPAGREEVAELVPDGTRRAVDEFSRCATCGQVFWVGAHHRRLDALVQRVREQVGRSAR